MTKVSIPKIPQNLPVAVRAPLDKLRQAVVELSRRVDEPIDARTQVKFGTVTEDQIEPDLLTDVNAVRYYIDPVNGTAIKNSSGTLTVKATLVNGLGTTVLSSGPIKMYKPDGTLAGNGYTWTAAAADISDSIIITLKDSITKVEWDTITLIDVTDGGDAVIGSIVADNGLSWSRAIDAGVWTPAATTTDLTCTFYQLGASIATRVVRITRAANGTMTAALQSNNGEPTSHNVVGSGTTAISIEFIHTASSLSVFETVVSVQGGLQGSSGIDGYNAATLTAYKRAAVAPTDDPGVSITYTFATAAWAPGNGWTAEIPAGSNPLYAVSATAFSQAATDNVLSADWSAPTLILQDGAAGGDGLNVATAYIYQRTATDSAPTLPSASATYTFATGAITGLNNGWTDTIPAAGGNPFLWASIATASSLAATDAIGSGEWQSAEHLAEDGADGLSSQLTNAPVVIESWGDGTNYSLSGTGGTHQVLEGATDKTTTAVHSVVGGSGSPHELTQNGLTMSVVVATGVYSLSGASWTSDTESFTLRAAYLGLNFDKVYTVTKNKVGGIELDSGVPSSDSITDLNGGPGTAEVWYKLDSDGFIYTAEGTTVYTQREQWLGDGVVADYAAALFPQEFGTQDTPSSGSNALSTWLPMGTDRNWHWVANTIALHYDGIIKFRRISDETVIGQWVLTADADDS